MVKPQDLSRFSVARKLIERKQPGHIINVASMLSFQGGIRVAAYTAAKSGLLGLTRAMANELAPLGINVNAIAPGYMATDHTEALRNDPMRSHGARRRWWVVSAITHRLSFRAAKSARNPPRA